MQATTCRQLLRSSLIEILLEKRKDLVLDEQLSPWLTKITMKTINATEKNTVNATNPVIEKPVEVDELQLWIVSHVSTEPGATAE